MIHFPEIGVYDNTQVRQAAVVFTKSAQLQGDGAENVCPAVSILSQIDRLLWADLDVGKIGQGTEPGKETDVVSPLHQEYPV